MTPKPPPPHPLGFSVLELLVVLGLMATVFGLMIPSLAQPLDRQHQRAAIHRLYGHLNQARFMAIQQGTWVSACPSVSGRHCDDSTHWHTGWIVFVDGHKTGQPASEGAIVIRGEGRSTALITSGARRRIRFGPGGHAYGSNGTIRQCARSIRGPSHRIVISNAGRVRFVKPDQMTVCDGL